MKVIALLTLLAPVSLTACSEQAKTVGAPYEPANSFLATGNALSGREAFSQLQCGVCHKVAGDEAFQSPTTDGPELGSKLAGLSANVLADSIVASHSSTRAKATPVTLSADYAKVITVRQLIDLVGFMKSLPR